MEETILDDAYLRLLKTGPEFDGWLSNHGPMVIEALARHGHEDTVMQWLDGYASRLEEAPPAGRSITDWRSALGDPGRLRDWLHHFEVELSEGEWTAVLHRWWPRLLPGIAAGATHGVIRVGHAVRVLREEGEGPARLAELGQGLAYWAARWQAVPGVRRPRGLLDGDQALLGLPLIEEPMGGIRPGLQQLTSTAGWEAGQVALAPASDATRFLRDLITASVRRYATHAHGDAVMMVHAATAPNAVLRVLPSLPVAEWRVSAETAWSASAAVHAVFSPRKGLPAPIGQATPADAFTHAVDNGDEHVIKLADTALDVHAWSGEALALSAIARAAELITPA